MRKTVLSLISALVIVFVGLSLICRDKGYEAEKFFYYANKKFIELQANPEPTPPAMISSIASDFEYIMDKYPETEAAKAAHLTLAEFYYTSKDYATAVTVLDTFIAKYKNTFSHSECQAYVLRGLAYERQGNWPAALQEFNMVKNKFLNTPFGIQVPLYIAKHYEDAGDGERAKAEYHNAVVFYKQIADNNEKTVLAYSSLNMLVQAYTHLKEYEDAAKVVEGILAKYPTTTAVVLEQATHVENLIVKELNQPNRAVHLYRYVAEKVVNKGLKKSLCNRANQIEEQVQAAN